MINRQQLKEKYGDEKVFVVPVNKVEGVPDKFTFSKHDDKIWQKYDNQGIYINRWEAEGDSSFQQIIPYFFVMNADGTKVFIAKRIDGDHRLVDKLSLGFGGHIDSCDGYNEVVLKALTREMWEELDIEPLTKAIYMGTIRDMTSSTNDHFGLVFGVKAEEDKVFIKETDKLIGEWMTFEQLYENYHKFENWSKFLIDFFLENKN